MENTARKSHHHLFVVYFKDLNKYFLAVFSRQPLSRLTFRKVFCLQTLFSDLKMIGVFTS